MWIIREKVGNHTNQWNGNERALQAAQNQNILWAIPTIPTILTILTIPTILIMKHSQRKHQQKMTKETGAREAFVSPKCSFFLTLFKKPLTPTPTLRLNIDGEKFSGKIFKKCKNARHDKI